MREYYIDVVRILIGEFYELKCTVIALVFWGLWLFPIGYLIFRSISLPKIIGVLLMIGCFGYLIDSTAYILAPDMGLSAAAYTSIGELVFPLWLLFKGDDEEQWLAVAGEPT